MFTDAVCGSIHNRDDHRGDRLASTKMFVNFVMKQSKTVYNAIGNHMDHKGAKHHDPAPATIRTGGKQFVVGRTFHIQTLSLCLNFIFELFYFTEIFSNKLCTTKKSRLYVLIKKKIPIQFTSTNATTFECQFNVLIKLKSKKKTFFNRKKTEELFLLIKQANYC